MPTNFTQLAERYQKRYKSHFNDLEKYSLLAKTRSLHEMDYYAAGRLCAQWERDFKLREANGSTANLGLLPNVALDVLMMAYGQMPIATVASVQPIPDRQGIVYCMKMTSQSSRGNVNSGDDLMSVLDPPDVIPDGFAASLVETVNFVSASNGAQSYDDASITGGDDYMAPVDPRNIEISGSTVFNSGADSVTWPTMKPDPTTGQFSGAKVVNSNLYSVFGTVNFTAGTIDVQFSADPSGQTTMTARFATLNEETDSIATQILTLHDLPVRAHWFALRGTYGYMQQYELQRRLGKAADKMVSKNLMDGLNVEIMNRIIKKILAAVPNGNLVTWNRSPQTGVDYQRHKMSLGDAMADSSRYLLDTAGRGNVNVWICGSKAATIISRMEGFKLLYNSMDYGPHIFGTIDGQTIVRVPSSTQLDALTMLGICRSGDGFESPVVWAPYAPPMSIEAAPFSANPFKFQTGVCCAGAIETMVPNLSTKLVVDDTGFDYGSNA